jgi:magnesium chelatase subunit I
LHWFFESEGFELLDDDTDVQYQEKLNSIAPLDALVNKYSANNAPLEEILFLKEMVLWGLVAFNKLSKHRFSSGTEFKDLYGSYIKGL